MRNGLPGLMLTFLFTGAALAQVPPTGDDHLRQTSLRVYQLDMHRQFPGATLATVDSLLSLYSDSVVYEHPGVGAVVRGKTALREGMVQYLGSRPLTEIGTPGITIGPGVAVVETPAGPDPRAPSRAIPPGRRAIRVIEFDGSGLVRRIIDYPW